MIYVIGWNPSSIRKEKPPNEWPKLMLRAIPEKKDIRYRSWKEIKSPQSNAVIVFMMDVSGSMGEEQKELVRLESFWIDTWLRKNYEGIESRYIVHDVSAKEVDKHTFYHLREDVGTKISSAFGRNRDSKMRPRYSCVTPRWRPCPIASITVTPTCPVSASTASITVSTRSRITTASTFTISGSSSP